MVHTENSLLCHQKLRNYWGSEKSSHQDTPGDLVSSKVIVLGVNHALKSV